MPSQRLTERSKHHYLSRKSQLKQAAQRMGPYLATLLLGLLLLTHGAASAQEGSGDDTRTDELEIIIDPAPGLDRSDILGSSDPPRESDIVQPVTRADLNALIYYGRTGQFQKLDAEIRRLRRQNPGWEVPDELFRQGPVVGEQEVWDLYSRGQYSEARSLIARKQARNPGWQPSEDILEALDEGEKRKRLQAAAAAGQWRTVLTIADQTPSLLSCRSVDAMWLAAEAAARLDRADRAVSLYAQVLRDCDTFKIRTATLEKAAERVDAQRLEQLFTVAADRSHGSSEAETLARLRERLLRGKVAQALAENADAKEGGTEQLSPAALQQMEAQAKNSQDAETALLLAWYYLRRDQASKAEPWFRHALDWGAGADARQGLILSLQARGRLDEAERMAWQYRDASPDLAKTYTAVAQALLANAPPGGLAADRLERLVQLARSGRRGGLAADLGWYYQKRGQTDLARTWFEQALDWGASAKAAEGLALVYQSTGETAKLEALFQRWAGRSKAVARLRDAMEGGGPPSPIVAALQAGRYGHCLRLVRAEEAKTDETNPDLTMIKGWCLLNLDRPSEADRCFASALESGGETDGELEKNAAYGRILALEARGLYGEAYDVAVTYQLEPEDRDALRSRVITRLAQQAYDDEAYAQAIRLIDARARYGPPERGLLMLKGWAHFQLRQTGRALEIFKALDDVLSTPKTREAIDITQKEMYMGW